MPRQDLPPTPASSTEIKGKDGGQFSTLQMSFELPPPAVAGTESSPSSASTKASSASSFHPTSPKSPGIPASEMVKIRRRSSMAQPSSKDIFALPPPPTRSRKIIQMKPRGQEGEAMETFDASKAAPGKVTLTPKKKQPSSTSVAGRKIARKTAHSLIERRRRSKMNEEFGVLKDMIPACTGEMHKLAILQASIDYVRYLEDCVAKLKEENNRSNSTSTSEQFVLPPAVSRGSYASSRQHQNYADDDDVDMEEQSSPGYNTPHAASNRPSASPALLPQDSRGQQDSYSSITDQRHYSFSTSSNTSPALGPGQYSYTPSNVGSTLTSPALLPQRDVDQEVTAALLMLNTDRRGTQGSISGRGGMSVKDLLST
ncbi:Sterol regulatory element-binding 1 [Hyphodiscus hymeniophilus]|uniref:Sterol regulatory element-binding 1 n=1 Tax=Hyphodiscus hymeniophilus TaxID=353542 RepID=A0A9P6VKG7_9HELO|nr:Sterol regulatory element-binding 1 [Hyphodiscus hymeniophilus]